eukprot:767668-Hanusia_phi.AAC.7
MAGTSDMVVPYRSSSCSSWSLRYPQCPFVQGRQTGNVPLSKDTSNMPVLSFPPAKMDPKVRRSSPLSSLQHAISRSTMRSQKLLLPQVVLVLQDHLSTSSLLPSALTPPAPCLTSAMKGGPVEPPLTFDSGKVSRLRRCACDDLVGTRMLQERVGAGGGTPCGPVVSDTPQQLFWKQVPYSSKEGTQQLHPGKHDQRSGSCVKGIVQSLQSTSSKAADSEGVHLYSSLSPILIAILYSPTSQLRESLASPRLSLLSLPSTPPLPSPPSSSSAEPLHFFTRRERHRLSRQLQGEKCSRERRSTGNRSDLSGLTGEVQTPSCVSDEAGGVGNVARRD